MPARPQPATSHPRPVVGRVERFFASVALAALAVAAAAVSVEIAARVYLVRFAPEWTFRKYASHAQMRERYGPNGSLYALHPYLGFVLASNYAQGRVVV